MRTIDRLYILDNDLPLRRYRHIAAISDEDSFHIQFYIGICEGTDPRERPFDDLGNPDVVTVICATKSEAISRAEEERTLSHSHGWHDYKKERTE